MEDNEMREFHENAMDKLKSDYIASGKVIGLYDRDELRLRKATLDEAPALFQLATLYTLIVVARYRRTAGG